MANERVDVVIIGGGPGGYVAAIRASQLNANVVLVERDVIGGTCLNRGCIPTKALFTSTEVLLSARDAARYGVEVGGVKADLAKMVARKDQVVNQLVKGVEFLLKRGKVRTIKGTATIVGPNSVEVISDDGTKETIDTRTIMVATGSESAQLPFLPFDGQHVINSTDILNLTEAPTSLAIIGAGAIGMEFAGIFNALGTQVTVIEMLPQVLPTEDKEIADILSRELMKKKIKTYVNTKVDKAEKQNGQVVLTLSNGETVRADKVLVAAGRKLNVDGIGLEKVGVNFDKKGIKVNQYMQTNVPSIYAIGDVAGGMLLAHKASKEGIVASENIMGHKSKMDYRVIPRTVWTDPEIGSVGMTEQQAIEAGYEVKIGKFPFRALGRAVALGKTEGIVKLVADAKTDELLGAHIIGPEASDLIAEAATAMALETTVEALAETIHAHPTLAESMMEAAHVLEGQGIHI